MIELKTIINAPIERCFELSTSIDLHKISANKSQEEAIDGVTEGVIHQNKTVTWRAKHFGIWYKLEVRIIEFEKPKYFIDEMVNGPFKYMKHKHMFEQKENQTIMIDYFDFASPLGIIGKIFDKLILKRYLTNFLMERNGIIKEFAETDKWKQFL